MKQSGRRLGRILIAGTTDDGLVITIEHQVQVWKHSGIEFHELGNPPEGKQISGLKRLSVCFDIHRAINYCQPKRRRRLCGFNLVQRNSSLWTGLHVLANPVKIERAGRGGPVSTSIETWLPGNGKQRWRTRCAGTALQNLFGLRYSLPDVVYNGVLICPKQIFGRNPSFLPKVIRLQKSNISS